MDTSKYRHYQTFAGYRFCTTRRKKGRASKGCPLTIQPALGCAEECVFLFTRTLLSFSCFLRLGRMTRSFFFVKKSVAGFATKCPVKENVWARKSGFNREKTMGTSISYTSRQISASTCAETVGTACSATKNSSAATNRS